MKRTKNMIYRETEESRELALYIVNESTLYFNHCKPVVKNLAKKYQKGIFDNEKAADAFYSVATAGSKAYNRDFGYTFSVGDRFTVACNLVDYFMDEITSEEE